VGLPLVLFAAGLAIRTFGQLKADSDQANAERANASYFREQEAFTLEEMFREVNIFEGTATRAKGEQLVHAGSQGTAITSFTLDRLGQQTALMESQKESIIRQGKFKARLASLRANQADENVDALNSPERKLANLGGLLTGAAGFR
jgi:hypothetical protein